MNKQEVIFFKNGTSLELHEGDGLSKTVYVSENGWRTDNCWTIPGAARIEFEGAKGRAKAEGRLLEQNS